MSSTTTHQMPIHIANWGSRMSPLNSVNMAVLGTHHSSIRWTWQLWAHVTLFGEYSDSGHTSLLYSMNVAILACNWNSGPWISLARPPLHYPSLLMVWSWWCRSTHAQSQTNTSIGITSIHTLSHSASNKHLITS